MRTWTLRAPYVSVMFMRSGAQCECMLSVVIIRPKKVEKVGRIAIEKVVIQLFESACRYTALWFGMRSIKNSDLVLISSSRNCLSPQILN